MGGYGYVSFLTDYGLADGFVAACHGVLARLAPDVRVIDVTHLVPAGDVRRGATVLAQTVPSLPAAVHLAVVDPGVGTERAAVVLITPGGVLVGPDNGLLVPAAEVLGGVLGAYRLADTAVPATFHGRDVFAPAAGRLAAGVAPAELGEPVDAGALVRLPPVPARVAAPGVVETAVQGVDHFGNVQLGALPGLLAAAGLAPGDDLSVGVAGDWSPVPYGRTFGSVPAGALVLLVDSAGYLALAVNGGDAAARLRLAAGDPVALRSR